MTEPLIVDAKTHQKVMDEWALAIGRLMVQFTECEYWTYLYIRTFGSERLREAAGELMLRARAPVAEALLLDINLVPETADRVRAAFKQLSKLAQTRNLVAHNGPMLHVYADHRGQRLLQIELRSNTDESKSITLKRLDELTAEGRELDSKLSLLYGIVRKPEPHLNCS